MSLSTTSLAEPSAMKSDSHVYLSSVTLMFARVSLRPPSMISAV